MLSGSDKKMRSQLLCLFPVIFIIIVATVFSVKNENSRNRIQADLTRRNKRVVSISALLSYPHYGSPTKYEVTYLTPENELYKSISVFWSGPDIFWSEPEFLRRVSPGEAEQLALQMSGDGRIPKEITTLSKEALIDGLTSGSQQEQLSTLRQIRRLKDDIDELVVYIVQDMATDDPDLAVRKAARETVRYLV